ncbi:hypothetical protein PAXRUDRAFT_135759, partial [Paxillus rubicundulus Ve08.2h10]
ITSNIFPHLMPACEPSMDNDDKLNVSQDWYRELMRAARIWQLLKLLNGPAWNHWPRRLGLVLFCPVCPQPSVRFPLIYNALSWKYTWMVVMDGNFKAKDMHDHWPNDQVSLMDSQGYMMGREKYQLPHGGKFLPNSFPPGLTLLPEIQM